MKLPKPLGSVAHFQIDGPTIRIGIPYPASRPAGTVSVASSACSSL